MFSQTKSQIVVYAWDAWEEDRLDSCTLALYTCDMCNVQVPAQYNNHWEDSATMGVLQDEELSFGKT